ncbi:hypothetical protein QCA50_010829 [Cerrena zonata]|uniref:Uncharacterized protein n=1 Tax=Cerrena zonata TaxID=2478898 RepID=A0AAW0FX02_9APHY
MLSSSFRGTLWLTPLRTPLRKSHLRCISTKGPRNDRIAAKVHQTSPKPQDPTETEIPSPVEKEDKLPLLSRPLGVKEPPSTESHTWAQNMTNQEVRMEQRDKLIRAVGKGYFADLNATRRHGGKTWIAPRVLIREDKARYFPDITGTPLNSSEKLHTTSMCLGKVSIISLLSSKMSEIQTTMLIKPTNDTYSSHPLYQHIQINLQEKSVEIFSGISICKQYTEIHT